MCDREPSAKEQRSNALRAAELVRGQRQHVDCDSRQIKGKPADELRCVRVEDAAGRVGQLDDLLEVVEHAGLIVRRHDRNKSAPRATQSGTQFVEAQLTVTVYADDRQIALLIRSDLTCGFEHCGMFDGAHDDVAAVRRSRAKRQIICLGGPRGNHKLVRRASEQLGEL